MWIGVEILKGEEALVLGFFEGVGDCGPVGGAVEEGAEGFEGVVGAFLGELLEVDVLDAVAELADPVFGELEHHNVACVEVDFDVVGLEAVHELDHFTGGHEVAIEEDVLDVHVDPQFLGFGEKFADGVTGSFVAKVIWGGVMIGSPGHVYGTGYDEKVFGAEVVGGLGHEAGEFEASGPFLGIVAGERVGPEEKGAESTDFDADLFGHFSDGSELLGSALGGEVAFEIVVQFDAVEACVFGESEAFLEVHPIRVGEGPEVDGFFHFVPLGGSSSGVRFGRGFCGFWGGCGCGCGYSGHSHGEFEGGAAGEVLGCAPWGGQFGFHVSY